MNARPSLPSDDTVTTRVEALESVSSTMSAWGVVVAGGSGTRFGARKQLENLGDRRVLDWSVDALAPVCDGIVVVVPADSVAETKVEDADAVVGGGATRSDSVRAGLAALGPGATHVLIHDAARPLATPALAARVLEALRNGASGAVPVVEVSDSLRTRGGKSVDRSRYVAVQTPQGFALEALKAAHASGEVASDDASLLDTLGLEVVHVDGESTNLKITDPHDLQIAEVLLHGR